MTVDDFICCFMIAIAGAGVVAIATDLFRNRQP